MAAAAASSSAERPEPGFESMSHFVLDTEQLVVMLENMDFCSGNQNQAVLSGSGRRDRKVEESCDWLLHMGVWPFSSGADKGDSEDSDEGSEVSFVPRYEELDGFNLYLFEILNSSWLKECEHLAYFALSC